MDKAHGDLHILVLEWLGKYPGPPSELHSATPGDATAGCFAGLADIQHGVVRAIRRGELRDVVRWFWEL